MCVIISVYQKQKKINNTIIDKVDELRFSNPDGIGVVGFDSNKKHWTTKRELNIDKSTIKKVFQDSNVINIHLRSSTAGKINKTNVHFWENGDWMFAHNGVITEYSQDKFLSDSRIFFDRLITYGYIGENGKIKYKKIKKMMNKLTYWGRFILINTKTNKIYYFGDFHAYMMNKNTLIISTQSINFNDYFDLYGVVFREKNKNEVMKVKMKGIFYIDIDKETLKQIEDKDLATSYYGGGFKQWNN